MTEINTLIPRQATPALEVSTVNGGIWKLSEQRPENFTLVVFYRGFHCPVCGNQLRDLERHLEAFAERGVNVIAVSSDSKERAEKAKQDWKLNNLVIGYGISLDTAREWGLYISTSRGVTSTGVMEPDMFSEPAQYLIRPDGTLFFGSVQTMPFARPRFDDIIGAIDFVLKNNYPARGEVVNHKTPANA